MLKWEDFLSHTSTASSKLPSTGYLMTYEDELKALSLYCTDVQTELKAKNCTVMCTVLHLMSLHRALITTLVAPCLIHQPKLL